MTREEFISLLEADGFTRDEGLVYYKQNGYKYDNGYHEEVYAVGPNHAQTKVTSHVWLSFQKELKEVVYKATIFFSEVPFSAGETNLSDILRFKEARGGFYSIRNVE